MKITKTQLREIIREEVQFNKLLLESNLGRTIELIINFIVGLSAMFTPTLWASFAGYTAWALIGAIVWTFPVGIFLAAGMATQWRLSDVIKSMKKTKDGKKLSMNAVRDIANRVEKFITHKASISSGEKAALTKMQNALSYNIKDKNWKGVVDNVNHIKKYMVKLDAKYDSIED